MNCGICSIICFYHCSYKENSMFVVVVAQYCCNVSVYFVFQFPGQNKGG